MVYQPLQAVAYAKCWAMGRNPRYGNFEGWGGDCTNFVSQCLHAGNAPMNYRPDVGWYYVSLQNRSAAWTGVEFLYRFLIKNTQTGPYGQEIPLEQAGIGDVIQLSFSREKGFSHSLLVVAADPLRVATHSDDAFLRPLSSYTFAAARALHIEAR